MQILLDVFLCDGPQLLGVCDVVLDLFYLVKHLFLVGRYSVCLRVETLADASHLSQHVYP